MAEESKGFALSELSASLANLVESTSKSVVAIEGSHRRGGASGFVWRENLVVTAEEALGRHDEADVAFEDRQYRAAIVGRDPSTDIAVLRVEGLAAPPLPLSPSVLPRMGAIVLAVGRRNGRPAARFGIVSQTGPAWRSLRGGQIDSMIRLDLALEGRSEGAPAIDSEGRVFAMAVRGPRRSVLGIPAATIERIAARILEKGSIRPGYLGLGLHPVRINAKEGETQVGLMVLGVAEGGPGQAAGILQGDVIIAWNSEPITGMRDIVRRLSPDAVGQTAEIGLKRAGQLLTVRCLIGARPAT